MFWYPVQLPTQCAILKFTLENSPVGLSQAQTAREVSPLP